MKSFKVSSLENLGELQSLDEASNLFICFSNNTDLIHALQNSISKSRVIGCSSSGGIHNSTIVNLDNTMIVNVLTFKETVVEVCIKSFIDYDDSYNCGVKIGESLYEKSNPAGSKYRGGFHQPFFNDHGLTQAIK